MSEETFASWFCLKEGHDNFNVSPEKDQRFLFGKAEWRDQIHKLLKRALLLKEPVKLVWWGDYGSGKTHRLQYMRHIIQEEDLAFYPVYVVCRDVDAKSGFDRLHFDLVNNLDRVWIQEKVNEYLFKLRQEEDLTPIEDLCNSPDIVNAIRNLGNDSEQLWNPSWKFLTGLRLDKPEVQLANVTKPMIDSSVDYAAILNILATIIEALEHKQLLYLIDQAEVIQKVTNKDQEGRWVETLRAVLDVPKLGIVLAVGAVSIDQIPRILLQPEVLRRFKQDNYIQMAALKKEEAEEFIIGLLKEWVDAEKRDALAVQEDWGNSNGYSPKTFPFDDAAFTLFCRYTSQDPRSAKPSEIIARLNNITAEAFLNEVRLITRDFLVKLGINA